jgi:hypothetical protein
MPATCRCGRHWTGLSQAHCPTCHEHFSSVANFDRHRPGAGGCQDPAAVTKRNGDPVFKASVNGFGTTWVGAGEYAGPGNDADPAIAIAV